jgi:pyruvate/2-oxoglutarate dehydrogenase complex dihydrolipoamide dehydrogenase (E3) component
VAISEGRCVGSTCVVWRVVPQKLMIAAAQCGDVIRKAVGGGGSGDTVDSTCDMLRRAGAKAAE